MANPFPGMNPYLEQQWGDPRHRLVTYIADNIQPRLPGQLRARITIRDWIEPLETLMYCKGGARLLERFKARPIRHPQRGVDEPATEGFIDIVSGRIGAPETPIVTSIQVAHIAHKIPGEARDLWLVKRRECEEKGACLVEIDLLRAGGALIPAPPGGAAPGPGEADEQYRIGIWRGWSPCDFECLRAPVQERLPLIRIPLRPTDDDILLDLQSVVDRLHDHNNYNATDYAVEPIPALAPTDAAWTDELLRGKGLR